MSWTTNQRTFCLSLCLETKSFKSVQAKYRHGLISIKFLKKVKFIDGLQNFKQKEQ